jgi:flagellar hook-associated protein 3 FlgL
VASNSANASAQARSAAAIEVRQLFAQAVSVANTRVGDEYLFGGLNNDGRPPVRPGRPTSSSCSTPARRPAPRFPQGVRAVEVGAGGQLVRGRARRHHRLPRPRGRRRARPDHGRPARRSSGCRRRSSRATGRRSGPRSRDLDSAFDGLPGAGGRRGRAAEPGRGGAHGLQALESTLTQQKADLSELDAERAITEMLARQTAYQAAMLASSKVMGMSLTDYLR